MKIEVKVDAAVYRQLEILAANDGVSVEDLLLSEIEWLIEERRDEILDAADDEKFNQFSEA